MNVKEQAVAELLRDVRDAVEFQRELGLGALDVADSWGQRVPIHVPGTRSGASGVGGEPQPQRPTTLEGVTDELGDCRRCELSKSRTSIVFGVGDPAARIMFVGEAPGRDEDIQGEPFVGAAGQLLTRMIEAGMGLSRGEVYIANIVKCRPPKNRDPQPDEVESCEPFLKKQIAVIQPEIIVALGRYAAQTLLRDTTPISRLRGQWREYEGIAVMPTFHPAYLLRNPAEKRPVWQDILAVMARLGLQRPGGA